MLSANKTLPGVRRAVWVKVQAGPVAAGWSPGLPGPEAWTFCRPDPGSYVHPADRRYPRTPFTWTVVSRVQPSSRPRSAHGWPASARPLGWRLPVAVAGYIVRRLLAMFGMLIALVERRRVPTSCALAARPRRSQLEPEAGVHPCRSSRPTRTEARPRSQPLMVQVCTTSTQGLIFTMRSHLGSGAQDLSEFELRPPLGSFLQAGGRGSSPVPDARTQLPVTVSLAISAFSPVDRD